MSASTLRICASLGLGIAMVGVWGCGSQATANSKADSGTSSDMDGTTGGDSGQAAADGGSMADASAGHDAGTPDATSCEAGTSPPGWPLCCPGNGCPQGEGCFGDVSYEGSSYDGGTCWSCIDGTGQPAGCGTCGSQGQPCCVIVGLHHVCRPGLTCPSDSAGGTCM